MEEVRIHHIMKDGTEVNDISGYVISKEKNKPLYEIIDRIQEERR